MENNTKIISVEAIALRNQAENTWLRNQCFLLQEELIQVSKKYSEILEKMKELENGSTT